MGYNRTVTCMEAVSHSWVKIDLKVNCGVASILSLE